MDAIGEVIAEHLVTQSQNRQFSTFCLNVAVVEYRPILSVNIVSQFQSSTFGHN